MPVSASHGLGTGDLLDRIVEAARRASAGRGAATTPTRVAVIGRPNAGKSSLVNAFLGSDRVIVSERAGTTRDAIDTEVEVDGRGVVLVDTAGLRRRSKVAGTVDYYAQLRSERAVERADVAIVVCDADDGITAEDLRVAELAMSAGCATLLALNKWDVSRTDIDDARARVDQKLRLRPAVDHLLGAPRPQRRQPAAEGAAARRPRRRADPDARAQPLRRRRRRQERRRRSRRGRRLRLYYAAQVGERPPRFAIQVNDRKLIIRDWAYHLENRLRETYALEGVPLVIDFVPHSGRRGRRR